MKLLIHLHPDIAKCCKAFSATNELNLSPEPKAVGCKSVPSSN